MYLVKRCSFMEFKISHISSKLLSGYTLSNVKTKFISNEICLTILLFVSECSEQEEGSVTLSDAETSIHTVKPSTLMPLKIPTTCMISKISRVIGTAQRSNMIVFQIWTFLTVKKYFMLFLVYDSSCTGYQPNLEYKIFFCNQVREYT